MDSHIPYAPINRIKEWRKINNINIKALTDGENLTPEELDYLKELYAEEVCQADKIIGEILEYLKKKLDWDKSLVIVTSDHGESFGETDYFSHVRHKLNNPHSVNIPIFFLGGLAGKTDYQENICLQDLYYLVRSFLTNKKTPYKQHRICLGYEVEMMPGGNVLNAAYFPCSYCIPDKNVIFEGRERLNKENVPEELREIYFKDEAKPKSI